MELTTHIQSKNLLKVQELVKQYNWRFVYIFENRNGTHTVCLNSNNTKNTLDFTSALYAMDYKYKETVRKYSLFKKIKINFKKLFLSFNTA